jgi:pyridoxamine 5'-phosphate oxidase
LFIVFVFIFLPSSYEGFFFFNHPFFRNQVFLYRFRKQKTMNLDIKDLRQEYSNEPLNLTDVDPNPFAQFRHWFSEALDSSVLEPNAMTLSTITLDGRPTARVVLLKEFNPEGFVFFTNYESRKGQELAKNPHACLVFNWLELARQVRIEGQVERIPEEDSTAYFQSRPRGSQIGAWASPQSSPLADRSVLEKRLKELNEKYGDFDTLPRPEHWGGYLLRPSLIEFWQGRASRLHDRIQYTRRTSEDWDRIRLAP